MTAFAACGFHDDDANAPVLLFNGAGTSRDDVAAVEAILRANGVGYTTSDSARLNEMSESEMRGHRLMIVPGGNFEVIGDRLTSRAAANVRSAVQHGLNYLGICAGAFFAGDSPYNGLNLTSGVRFPFYAAEARGVRKTVVEIASAGMPTLDQYWEDGPQLTGWGEVVARYPDGTPAIAQGEFAGGWIVLTGVHPEAPAGWRRGLNFRTPMGADHAYAGELIRAALTRKPLPHY